MIKESNADCIATLRIREENKNGKKLIIDAIFKL